MSLPAGLTPAMVRKALADETTYNLVAVAEASARAAEEAVLDGEGVSDPQERFARCKAKGAEHRIRSVCDVLGVDHSGWTP